MSRNTTLAATGDLWRVGHLFEQAYQGRLLPLAALDAVEQEIEVFQRRQAMLLAAKNDEVSGNREGLLRRDASETSAKAAAAIGVKSGTQRSKVLESICSYPGGSTDYEIAGRLGILENSVRPRRSELVTAGYVTDSGKTRKHRGSQWVLWIPTAEGLAWVERNRNCSAAA